MINHVEQFRKEIHLTQEQLAEKAGVSKSTIIIIESGNYKDLKASTMSGIARALSKSIDECFCMDSPSSALDENAVAAHKTTGTHRQAHY